MPRLILHPDTPHEQVFPLGRGPVLLGRADDNDIPLPHHSVSRRHARIEPSGRGGWVLMDLGSTNGTFVGDKRIERTRVRLGDAFRVGDLDFRLAGDPEVTEPTFLQEIDPLRAERFEHTKPERVRDRLETLIEISRLLSPPMGVEALGSRVLELLAKILPYDRAALLLQGPDGALEVQATHPPGEDVPYSRSMVDYARDRRVAALFAASGASGKDPAAPPQLASLRTAACAPLVAADEALGALHVDRPAKDDPFDAEDLELLTAFANQAALAVQRARHLDKIESDAILKNNLLRFFAPSTAKTLIDTGETALGGTEAEATAIYVEIFDFSEISIGLGPRQTIEWLADIYATLAEIVYRHEGTLEKFVGDAMLAVWGAPVRKTDDPKRAANAAIDIMRALPELNERLGQAGWPTITVRVGMNTGKVAAGNIGTPRYVQYATIGDTTSVAARIAVSAKPGEILASRSTSVRLGTGWALDSLGGVRLGPDFMLDLFRVPWQA